MRHYSTLFDSKYLPQGLALYDSLVKHSSEPFRLYVLALDEECSKTLGALALPHLTFVPLKDFECATAMAAIRATRTWQEYAWTCASVFTDWLSWYQEITYLDADCFFFGDPEQIHSEIGSKSIGIVPHRFPPHRKHMEANGRFNVSWVTFNGPIGLKCLQKWARQCREKCSANEGCGDQKYLDEWPSTYPGEVCEIQNIGVGAAPWNVTQYKVTSEFSRDRGFEDVRLDDQPLVMYHFHEYIHGTRLTNYKLPIEARCSIYSPYITAVEAAKQNVEAVKVTA